jgi:hypothetical protein
MRVRGGKDDFLLGSGVMSGEGMNSGRVATRQEARETLSQR